VAPVQPGEAVLGRFSEMDTRRNTTNAAFPLRQVPRKLPDGEVTRNKKAP
jgi:hypothetical protein